MANPLWGHVRGCGEQELGVLAGVPRLLEELHGVELSALQPWPSRAHCQGRTECKGTSMGCVCACGYGLQKVCAKKRRQEWVWLHECSLCDCPCGARQADAVARVRLCHASRLTLLSPVQQNAQSRACTLHRDRARVGGESSQSPSVDVPTAVWRSAVERAYTFCILARKKVGSRLP